MATNNEIKPSLKEKIYQETLDEFARKQWNPESLKNDFKNWKELVEVYPKKNRGWLIYQADVEKAVKLAIDKTESEARSDTTKQIFKEIDKIMNRHLNSSPIEDIDTADELRLEEDYLTLKRKYKVD